MQTAYYILCKPQSKSFIVCLYFLVHFTTSIGQIKIAKQDVLSKYVFKSNHIRIEGSTLATFKARIKNETGSQKVGSSFTLGLVLGFKYSINFSNTLSIITGAEAMLLGKNFSTTINRTDFSPPLSNDVVKGFNSYSPDFILSVPVVLEKRNLYAKEKYVFFSGGIRMNASLGVDFETLSLLVTLADGSLYDLGGYDVYANNDAKPWVSIPLNAGHAWLLKNNNLLQLSITANISFTKYVNGTYSIEIPGRPITQGLYSSKGSFIGLSLNYVFTNANYRIRKAYEKMNGIQ